MSRDARRRRALTAAAAALPLVAGALAVTGTAQADDRQSVAGTHPAWARSSADRGKTDSSQRIDAKVWLSGRDPKGLESYALGVSTPGSAQFRKFLTPAQFSR